MVMRSGVGAGAFAGAGVGCGLGLRVVYRIWVFKGFPLSHRDSLARMVINEIFFSELGKIRD
jgi:hypothetical protein